MSLEHRGIRAPQGRPFEMTERTPRRAIIWTVGGIEIRGTVHVPPGMRTMDLLNREAEAFIAVTSATLSIADTQDRANFIAVNKAHIVAMREMEEESRP